MRHEVLIPFEFNTDSIEQALARIGEDEVRKKIGDLIDRHVTRCLPEQPYYRGDGDARWGAYLKETMFSWLDKHSEEIIDEAALLLAMRAGSKRKWRDVLAQYKEETA